MHLKVSEALRKGHYHVQIIIHLWFIHTLKQIVLLTNHKIPHLIYTPPVLIIPIKLFGLLALMCLLIDEFEWWLRTCQLRREANEAARRLEVG